ncbi:hypothetical protein BHU72_06425 [Desulfuribacillus stibiiarsenatis]|uniref:Uncharacterized protein n=1 Tax=Desulfuribacillus stibiiarsenatis TaxID=1390249 RepID=A0A1E5L524_9FIRM|nr:hypothetical protein [Desulfuribacillus stibiiarsenatis]OEH85235.1 hypothetical protein BHU72_06425 [Desulfuribacillus stibiiarsenatis]
MMNRDFWFGFAVGAVTGVVGYRLYEQNGGQLQQLIRPAFGQAEGCESTVNSASSVEDLVAQKERLEDLIAEKNLG